MGRYLRSKRGSGQSNLIRSPGRQPIKMRMHSMPASKTCKRCARWFTSDARCLTRGGLDTQPGTKSFGLKKPSGTRRSWGHGLRVGKRERFTPSSRVESACKSLPAVAYWAQRSRSLLRWRIGHRLQGPEVGNLNCKDVAAPNCTIRSIIEVGAPGGTAPSARFSNGNRNGTWKMDFRGPQEAHRLCFPRPGDGRRLVRMTVSPMNRLRNSGLQRLGRS